MRAEAPSARRPGRSPATGVAGVRCAGSTMTATPTLADQGLAPLAAILSFSSVAALVGAVGQANYVAANADNDEIERKRLELQALLDEAVETGRQWRES